MYYVLPSRFLSLFCMWTRPWEDTAVAIPPIRLGSSGHREQPGTNRSRIWTQNPAVIQACRWHRFIHGLDRWCLRWVITWILTPTRRVSATKLALQPGWLRLYTERDCETGHFDYLSLNGLSTITIYGARREWNWCGQLPFLFPFSVDYYRIWSGWGRCHVTAGLVSSGVARIR